VTTELVLLLGLFAFIIGGLFFGDKGPIKVFASSGPRLAARIERNITIGNQFQNKGGTHYEWTHPDANAPTGQL
jgi:hypothetical protein